MLAPEKEGNPETRGHLVISRKIGQAVIINGNIEVTIIDVDRGKVKIALKAPKSILILRSELLEEDRQDESEGEP